MTAREVVNADHTITCWAPAWKIRTGWLLPSGPDDSPWYPITRISAANGRYWFTVDAGGPGAPLPVRLSRAVERTEAVRHRRPWWWQDDTP